MRLIPLTAALLATAALSACATHSDVAVAPLDGTVSGICHTDMVRGAVGLAASQPTLERIRVDSDSTHLVSASGGDTQAGSETGGDTVTVHVGAHNAIASVRCG